MLLTPHILFALYLTKILPGWLAIPAALISHIVLDFFFPHWNPHIFTQTQKYGKIIKSSLAIIIGDSLLSLGFILYFMSKIYPDLMQIFYLGVVSLAAIFPDVIEIPYYFFHYKGKYLYRIINFQHKHQAQGDVIWGNLTQWGLATLCLYFLLK